MAVITPPPPGPESGPTREILLSLFTPIGRVRFLDEKHFDACTALSGSGPAFALLILEAMTDGGVMMGLPRGEALELASQCPYWVRRVLPGQDPLT
jgi:pyrroline-5-carboxylate reductase